MSAPSPAGRAAQNAAELPPEPAGAAAAPARSWPAPPHDAAYHRLAGRLVQTIGPHTEADPIAVLVQFLVAFGNAAGRGPHFMAEADRHYTNMYATLVGESAKGRKGTSWGQARRVVEMADETWPTRIASGLSSGEGLIWQVRDPIQKLEPVKQNGRVVGHDMVTVDEGVTDKRLLVYESEFALVLRALERDGNRLSGIVRAAWDDGSLRTLTKTSPAVATNAHISVVGHVTRDELLRYLCDTEAGNGFANRFLWICVRRSKLLPEGGALRAEDLGPLADEVRTALAFARTAGEVKRDEPARLVWRNVYGALSDGRSGLLGAVTARAEAQVMRLATIYALLDRSPVIGADHLRAGLALWEYAEASAVYIFGDRLGDPIADAILDALRQNAAGLTRTDISHLSGRHCRADRLERALAALGQAGKARCETETTAGRPAQRWFLA